LLIEVFAGLGVALAGLAVQLIAVAGVLVLIFLDVLFVIVLVLLFVLLELIFFEVVLVEIVFVRLRRGAGDVVDGHLSDHAAEVGCAFEGLFVKVVDLLDGGGVDGG
jgi:hypothetical protein